MGISAKAVVNGIVSSFKKEEINSSFKKLTWLQKKKLKHQEDKRLKNINVGGLKFNYYRPYEFLHTYQELFGHELYKFKSVKSTPFIIDCGANIGLSVVYFKTLFPEATVLAFEPDEQNYALLQQNIKLNNLNGVECRQSAVWIHNDDISFLSSGSQASQIDNSLDQQKKTTIRAERLADILKQQKVDFLKIDIEGAEVEVICDCSPFLHNVDKLFIEYHGLVTDTEKLNVLMQTLKKFPRVYIKMAADNLSHPFIQGKTNGSFDVQLNIFCY